MLQRRDGKKQEEAWYDDILLAVYPDGVVYCDCARDRPEMLPRCYMMTQDAMQAC